MITDIWHDLRYAFRVMRKSPGVTIVAVCTLALGIGANAAVFSLVDGILLSPLPYPESDRLVRFHQSYPEKGLETWRISQANFARYQDQNRSFQAVAAYTTAGVNLMGGETPEYLQIARVTGNFFRVLDANPALGRAFRPEDDIPGKNNVCILSHGLWERRFGGDRMILGRSLTLNDVATEVIGVMPPGFNFPEQGIEVWSPIGLNSQLLYPFSLVGIARLNPGVSPSMAGSDLTGILWNAAQEMPETITRSSPPPPGAGLKAVVVPLKEAIVGNTQKPLLILQIAVAFVLLVACANVANLLLSRATSRTQEIALRVALGASPGRIIKQLLTESMLLATIGATAGIVIAYLCLRGFRQLSFEGIPRVEEVGMSLSVLAFAVAVTLLTGLLFGLMPAIRVYRLGLKSGLSEGQKGSAGRASRWTNGALVATQLALSLMLLIGAGLMLKSFQRLLDVKSGFQSENVLTMLIPVASKKYASPEQSLNFYQSLLEQVRASSGIKAAGIASNIPLSGRNMSDGYLVEGHEPVGDGDAPQAQIKVVSRDYVKAMGMSLQYGRDFLDSDTQDSTPVAVVDETLARRYWPEGEAIGKRIRTLDPQWYTIVGVVSGVKDESLAGEMRPHLYLSFGQLYFAYGQASQRRMYLVVNTVNNPAAATSLIASRIRELDSNVPTYAVRTMTEVVNKTLSSQRLTNSLLTAFAAIALLLAAIGIYGVMLLFVSNRKPELAIRLALGASPGLLLRSILKEGLRLALVGIVAGLVGSWALTRAMSSQLFEVSTTDPVVFTALPLVLVTVALMACYLPARKAARTDPLVVMRSQ